MELYIEDCMKIKRMCTKTCVLSQIYIQVSNFGTIRCDSETCMSSILFHEPKIQLCFSHHEIVMRSHFGVTLQNWRGIASEDSSTLLPLMLYFSRRNNNEGHRNRQCRNRALLGLTARRLRNRRITRWALQHPAISEFATTCLFRCELSQITTCELKHHVFRLLRARFEGASHWYTPYSTDFISFDWGTSYNTGGRGQWQPVTSWPGARL